VDYAAWQRQHLVGPVLEEELRWWQETLAGAPPLLDMPWDKPRPDIASSQGVAMPIELDATAVGALRQLAADEHTTVFAVLLAAVQVFLSRYSRQEDIVVGTPYAGRAQQEVQQLVGCLVNTIALRGNTSGDPSFRQLLQQSAKTTMLAFAHANAPFPMVVDALKVARSAAFTPLYQVLLVVDDATDSETAAASDGLQYQPVQGGAADAVVQTDLTFQLNTSREGLAGSMMVSAALCTPTTAEVMARHFTTLLASVAAMPHAQLSALPLMDAAEQQMTLHDFNQTAAWLPELPTHAFFERQAAAKPKAACIVSGANGTTLTYAHVNSMANQLAHFLADAGVGPGVAVGVLSNKRAELYIALIAILKAGGCYVPIDHTLPAARISYIIQQADIKLLLAESTVSQLSEVPPVRTLYLDDSWVQFGGQPISNPPVFRCKPCDAAYIIFTSGKHLLLPATPLVVALADFQLLQLAYCRCAGSTGMPKGVQVPHTGIVNVMLSDKVRCSRCQFST
jgi:non-ribosomal peptide synthetase component F